MCQEQAARTLKPGLQQKNDVIPFFQLWRRENNLHNLWWCTYILGLSLEIDLIYNAKEKKVQWVAFLNVYQTIFLMPQILGNI